MSHSNFEATKNKNKKIWDDTWLNDIKIEFIKTKINRKKLKKITHGNYFKKNIISYSYEGIAKYDPYLLRGFTLTVEFPNLPLKYTPFIKTALILTHNTVQQGYSVYGFDFPAVDLSITYCPIFNIIEQRGSNENKGFNLIYGFVTTLNSGGEAQGSNINYKIIISIYNPFRNTSIWYPD